jgi:hypothetical protein
MSNTELNGNESTDVESRTRRVLKRVLTVTHTDGTPIDDDENPTVVSVHSGHSGKERRVDVREGRCTCNDHRHRETRCYHIRRAQMALGVEPVDIETLAACDLHSRFAEHAPGPVVATSDGGIVGDDSVDESDETETTEAGERVRVPVSGGVLIYETRALGRNSSGSSRSTTGIGWPTRSPREVTTPGGVPPARTRRVARPLSYARYSSTPTPGRGSVGIHRRCPTEVDRT